MPTKSPAYQALFHMKDLCVNIIWVQVFHVNDAILFYTNVSWGFLFIYWLNKYQIKITDYKSTQMEQRKKKLQGPKVNQNVL